MYKVPSAHKNRTTVNAWFWARNHDCFATRTPNVICKKSLGVINFKDENYGEKKKFNKAISRLGNFQPRLSRVLGCIQLC